MTLAFGAGLLLWSLPGARHLIQPNPVLKPQASARQRFEASQRLGKAMRDPKSLTEIELETARRDFGPDSAVMLKLLRKTAK